MMCDWNREFGEEAKEKQRKLGEELTVDMIKKRVVEYVSMLILQLLVII